ncbi:hypothetical protein AVEN_111407-1 [Araneus ventricosus]|uniref:Uncharacterized protein n=1 Tax=Araneus ventricosus TaxID=182803 RepID=A0A4Y2QXL1_ARAVE|nr:hypothetical protein AVEN_111407-1 [Araneus ventricosus]
MSDLLRHKRTDHSAPPAPRIAAAPRARNSGRNALGVYSSHFMTPTPAGKWDLLLFFEEVRPQIHNMIVDELQQKKAIKWYCVSNICFSRETPDGDVEYCTPYFRNKVVIELDTSMIGDHIKQAFEKIKESLDEFLKNGSGWVFDSVIHMELKTATYRPLAPQQLHPSAIQISCEESCHQHKKHRSEMLYLVCVGCPSSRWKRSSTSLSLYILGAGTAFGECDVFRPTVQSSHH